MQPALEVRHLTKSFGAVRAVDDISFSVPAGATVALLGGNGAGKTTTISMLLGLLLPSSGEVHALGHDLVKDRYAVLHRMNFSSPYVELPHRLTVSQNLVVYAELYGTPDAKGRVAELAERLHIDDLMDRPAGKLSAGQKTRVALAKALVNHPDLLLLDEPTASLDPDTGDWVRRYLEEYRADTGATILLASHNMAEVERLCDSVLMLRAGKIVDQGSPNDLLSKYGRRTMEDVFLDIARDRRAETVTEDLPA